MAERLLSVGLDVGTTSTQLVVSELLVENRASGFGVPELEICRRRTLYRGKVHFTPLVEDKLVDGPQLRRLIEEEYRSAGIRPEDVDTGAVIITGETSRKENAGAVLAALSDWAGDFVVATAGPELESILAAKGAGADVLSAETGKPVLHMDIGGGTSNLAWIEEGKILKTGCLNVGGRLVKLDPEGIVTYVSPVLSGISFLKPGDRPTETQLLELARILTEVLEMAAGLREKTDLFERLWTKECGPAWTPAPAEVVLSFSGGVADCMEREVPWLTYGDMGPVLGKAICQSRLCRGQYRLGAETIRATVIGAGCHSTQLSGSTVFCRNMNLPLKNLPVVRMESPDREMLRREGEKQEGAAVLALPGPAGPGYEAVRNLAGEIAAGWPLRPVLVCLEQDAAKALGQLLALELGPKTKILCIDRVRLTQGDYLDVGCPVGPALPVVVKTLILDG